MSLTQSFDPYKSQWSCPKAGDEGKIPDFPSKRHRVNENTRKARRAARAKYWDTLSKVWLTPRALREFDRRNAVQSGEQKGTKIFEHWPQRSSSVAISQLSAAFLKDLKLFARRGGPNLTDLRNCPDPSPPFYKAMSSHGSGSQGSSNTSGVNGPMKSSAYDCDFEQKCIDNYIYPTNYELPDNRLPPVPENSNYILGRLRRPRSSLAQSQFGEEAFGQFRRAQFLAKDETDVIADALPTILGGSSCKHRPAREIVFSNMQGMAKDIFNNPKPDLYYGARPEQIDQRVRQDLNNQIIPSTNQSHPAAPNFFVEVKGPRGPSVVNMRQACYGGAIGARGMHALQSYGQAEPTYDNRAFTYSSTYENGTLQMYSHHPAQPLRSGGPPEYHMTPLGGWALTGSMQTFREGVGAFRNARDLAREQRNKLIDEANGVARGQSVDRRMG